MFNIFKRKVNNRVNVKVTDIDDGRVYLDNGISIIRGGYLVEDYINDVLNRFYEKYDITEEYLKDEPDYFFVIRLDDIDIIKIFKNQITIGNGDSSISKFMESGNKCYFRLGGESRYPGCYLCSSDTDMSKFTKNLTPLYTSPVVVGDKVAVTIGTVDLYRKARGDR